MTEFELRLWYYIQENGMDAMLYNKKCKYLDLGEGKLYAYLITCDYIQGQDEDGNWIIDPQDEKALYLER